MNVPAKAPTDSRSDRFQLPWAGVCAVCLLLLATTLSCSALEAQAAQGAPLHVPKRHRTSMAAMSEAKSLGSLKKTWLVLRIVQQRWYHKFAAFFKRGRDVEVDRTLPVKGFEVVRMACHAPVGAGGRGGSAQIKKQLDNCHQQADASCEKKGLALISLYTYEVDERFVHRLRKWNVKKRSSSDYDVWEERFAQAHFFFFCQKKTDLEGKKDHCLGGSGVKFQPALRHQYFRSSTRDLMVAAVSSAFYSSAAKKHDVPLCLKETNDFSGLTLLTVQETEANLSSQAAAQVEPYNEALSQLDGWPVDGRVLREGTKIFIRHPFWLDLKAFAPPQKIEEATDILFIKIEKQRRRRLHRMEKRRLSKERRVITLQCYSGADQDRLRSCIDKLGDEKWSDEIFLASTEYDFLAAHMDAFLSPLSDERQLDQYKYVIYGDFPEITDSDSEKVNALHAPLALSLWPTYREQTAKKMVVAVHIDNQGVEDFYCDKLILRFSRKVWSIEAFKGGKTKQLPNVGNWVLVRFFQVDPIIRFDEGNEAKMMVRADDVDYLELKRFQMKQMKNLDYCRATNVIIGACDALSSFNITAEAFSKLQVWISRYHGLRLRSTKIFDDPEESELLEKGFASLDSESSL